MYNHNLVEKKWRKIWKDSNLHTFKDNLKKPKFYALDMFPYPSGAGLHMGHVKSYTPTDVYARFKRYQGYSVLHPMGWDAFGLPAEQFALATKNHPATFTDQNINNFKLQIDQLGFWFDWNKEVNTTDPNFYKWTQWIFIKLFENGLAEIKDIDVNWCQELGTVLANEEVLTDEKGNKVSERGKYPVIKKPMKQWVLKITKFADQLIDDLELTDWTVGLKNIQKKWIGKSIGATVKFKIQNSDSEIEVFTSRPDTIFGVSFIGLSSDHELVLKEKTKNKKIEAFLNELSSLKEYERTAINVEKKGVLLDIKAIHPITKQLVPVYVCNYVLSNYGNGAIMGVPAGDKRDYDFAKLFNLEIKEIIKDHPAPYEEDGIHINSDFLNGLNNEDAIAKIVEYLEKNKIGKKQVNYKLKDWLFSRQRYWGEPFPVLFDEKGNIIVEKNLPLLLPETNDIKPSGTGESPLANLTEWVNVKIDSKLYRRETNTMPQWAGSCWYYLAYLLKDGDSYLPLDSKQAYEIFKRWLPVDIYIGGQEHAVLHLLYARFWHKFLHQINVVPNKEPFYKIINQGMILVNGEKMSKSKGNVVNPSDFVVSHGADALRLYMMFMGPITASLPWEESGIDGMYKWVQRVYRLFETKQIDKNFNDENLEKKYHQFVKKASEFMENFDFNLVISEMMIFINECYKYEKINYDYMLNFCVILSCFAPFITEEINEVFLKNKKFISDNLWPKYDEKKIVETTIKIPVQINGKIREVLEINLGATQKDVVDLAIKNEKIIKWIENKKIVKEIYIENKILNLIIK
ncbi:leucine--tRNA ligase [Malacoplasma penetrans]|uniref:Leucine--tRNA ligase n=1 Tax=Malacoplasma penetrans (strain HF-2) TaxID=272633 RepID=SYL_MALP2|nr:leucine--tRNA ligase [Malacoplasma penetrans]Q8EW18.1 RecName: Full=Leucine--tRNA ligase; AltName: Full=Leucyl-tRNA synthetase; Short=LeuRS [Malacoplasma penetrans HF-2]RXY97187.1 leucine--tRNA ligase [Malacoplasma penetrans]BAC44178.1 leucyl-tRNA synthetase [Malacoplasma penetrans HF-2]